MSSPRQTLTGRRVLIPRGGELGAELARLVGEAGGQAIVAPLIAFVPPDPAQAPALAAALDRLRGRGFEWVIVTSATALDVLPDGGDLGGARLAVVGPGSAAAARRRGIEPAFVGVDGSASGLVARWPGQPGGTALLLQSELADDTVASGLRDRGADVEQVVAYRTLPVAPPAGLAGDVRAGSVDAILVTSGSVAVRVAAECSPVPASTTIACIGPRTARETRDAGLTVAAVAQQRSAAALVAALEEFYA